MIKSERHLFVVWDKARSKLFQIENDIISNFSITNKFEVFWDTHYFSDNLSRFYGKNLPPNTKKEQLIGTGPFILYIVEDNKPLYDIRKTSKGMQLVNTNIFDAKIKYRRWTSPGTKVKSTIHATNNIKEAKHDIFLLTGNTVDFYSKTKSNSDIEIIKNNLIGADGWRDLKQVFLTLNECIEYVVLRNFSNLIEHPISEEHTDIDILTTNYDDICHILNTKATHKEKFKVQNTVLINDLKTHFDFRSEGDNYYCINWEKEILKNRIFHDDGFFIPNEIDYFYSLLYHALIHKNYFSENYIIELSELGSKLKVDINRDKMLRKDYSIDLLSRYLNSNGYEFTTPLDLSVGYNISKPTDKYRVKRHLWRKRKKIKLVTKSIINKLFS